MSGSLHHARRFEKRPYRGIDGLEHREIEPLEGDADTVSLSSWRELIDHCARLGVSELVWPTFDCHCAIDVPLNEALAMQPALREALRRLTPEQVSGHELLSRIVSYLDRGEAVFFTS